MTKDISEKIDEVLEQLFYANNSPESEGEQKDIDDAKQAIVTLLEEVYRNGYNDNARDCNCDKVGIKPHQHLLDDGKSYRIVPHLQSIKQKG